ncbi:hypothetical protein A3A66_04370 [Microgenomates group bacterium RIFCSPLOWO2_01_FULL_46_13]|nr:MAG: hypothetical protein A2783_04320 [Microgenomates group bacterium RIFCSPHIGHO2_01_FULL_45_11]OGV94208.1 MAG: hypothetical protein A3A66_04370 [Microgenomates group bacterium RIFCSPLOWO2_01_FULL_46_13]
MTAQTPDTAVRMGELEYLLSWSASNFGQEFFGLVTQAGLLSYAIALREATEQGQDLTITAHVDILREAAQAAGLVILP